MKLTDWLRSFRPAKPVTAAEIRRELHTLKQQQTVTERQRDLLALDAVDDEATGLRWHHLDESVSQLAQRIRVLDAALPAAEAREAEAARQAEELAREKQLQEFKRKSAEAQKLVDTKLASLPSGEELTEFRDRAVALRSQANALRAWSTDVDVRRPLDPLDLVVTAMQHRINRVSRARWAGSSPITLGGSSPEEIAAAVERVEALERTQR